MQSSNDEPRPLASLDEPCGDLSGAKVQSLVQPEYRGTLGTRGISLLGIVTAAGAEVSLLQQSPRIWLA